MATLRTPRGRGRDVKKEKTDVILQKYNMELLLCLDEMKYKRDDLHKDVISLTDEQSKLEADLLILTASLARVNESLCHKLTEKEQCDLMIAEYEEAFQRILDGSESLLASVRKAVQIVAPDIIIEESEYSQSRTTSRQTARLSTTSHPVQTPLATSRTDTRGEMIKSRVDRDSRQPSRTDHRSDTEMTPKKTE